jgi:hypothetical protein
VRPSLAVIAFWALYFWCVKKGMSFLTYGQFHYGNKRNSPLAEFKNRNGFEECLVPRFYVPLTVKGTIVIAFKLHRDLVGFSPKR